jgi:hypothetical protein
MFLNWLLDSGSLTDDDDDDDDGVASDGDDNKDHKYMFNQLSVTYNKQATCKHVPGD